MGHGISSTRVAIATAVVGILGAVVKFTWQPVEPSFASATAPSMDRMMRGMSAGPSGDFDRDFAIMMIPHHQGAIDMAVVELRYGANERLRRIAQAIVVDQQQEIAAMRLVLNEELAPSTTYLAQTSVCRSPLPY